MTSREFIAKWYAVDDGRERRLSSVLKDDAGNIYSYGYHYPLAFRLNDIDVINTAGYSSSTGKHIAWAKQALNYDAVYVELHRGEMLRWIDKSTVLERLEEMKASKQKEMDAKKRKDTSIFEWLQHDMDRIVKDINRVKESM